MADEKDQIPTYEPLTGADLKDLPAAVKLEILLELLAERGIITADDFEGAIDRMLDRQRAAAPHAGRDAVKPKPRKR